MTDITDQIRRMPHQLYVIEPRYAGDGMVREFWHWIDANVWLASPESRGALWARVEGLSRA